MRRSGSLLIITLWLVTVLSVLAIAIARYLSLEVRLTKYHRAREQAKALARSGVHLAMQRLMRDGEGPEAEGYDWLGDDWAVFPQPEFDADPTVWIVAFPEEPDAVSRIGEVSIRIIDEARKLDVNTADIVHLTPLVGGDQVLAQTIVDAVDADTPSDVTEHQPDAEPPYYAKNGPFAAPEELNDLPGMTPEVYETLLAQTTPYAAGEKLNINTVTMEVLSALALSPGARQAIADFRAKEDGIFTAAGENIATVLEERQQFLPGDEDRALLTGGTFDVSSRVFRVVSEGSMTSPAVRARVEAVVRREGCEEGRPAPCILAWRDG